jgi:peptide/nickel transport system permease protein
VTLVYVLPAVLFATVGGIATGIYSALYSKSAFDRVSTFSSYVAYGIPSFLLALLAIRVVDPAIGNAFRLIPGFRAVLLPAAVLGTSLFAAQFRYTRAQSTEYIGQEFVTLLRAKGASNRLVARHLLRNAALPLLSLFFVDLLGVLVVNVFVLETVLGLPGFGGVGLQAILNRDMPLIIGITLTLATVGIVANLVQDAAYTVLDPRVETE